MPYYEKSEDWLKQSSLLIEARPTSTRVTTTYSVQPSTHKTPSTPSAASAPAPTPKPQGHLVLKTYDPVSGACLKYKTSKAAEVSRLVQMLGTLSKRMAGIPAPQGVGGGEDVAMADAPPSGADAGAAGSGANTPAQQAPVQEKAGGGGGKGKKKKGKR